jgi:transcription-repair coupling factor (superfamily II helicase)
MEKHKNKFYTHIDSILSETSYINDFDQVVLRGESAAIVNAANSSIKLILATRTQQNTKKNIWYITRDDKLAEDIAEDFAVLNTDSQVFFIPDFETLPYEERSPHYMIRSQRMRAISNLLIESETPKIFCLSFRNLIRNIINPRYIREKILSIKMGDEFDITDLLEHLVNIGYEHVTLIEKVGQMSRRGGIVDIFSPNYDLPFRLDFFGDQICSIRFFSVSTQRSEATELLNIHIVPSREVVMNDEATHSSLAGKIAIRGLYEGIEGDIPLIYLGKYSFFDYAKLSGDFVMFFDNFAFDFDQWTEYHEEISQTYIKIKSKKSDRKIADVDRVILKKNELEDLIKKYSVHFLNSTDMYYSSFIKPFTPLYIYAEPSPFFDADMQILYQHIQEFHEKGYQIFIQNENEAQKNRISQLLSENLQYVKLTIGVLHRGFIYHDAKLVVLTDHEIFRRVKHKKLNVAFSKGEAVLDYDSIKPGDYIVHINHGIGVYEGIKTIDSEGLQIECLCVRYTDNDMLYVPTWQLKLVAKYVSEEGVTPTINKLGSKSWENTKQKARKQIELVVEDIVNLYAERKLRKGIEFAPDSDWQTELEQSFIYDDTPDQTTATAEIKRDMESELPMERLLCGDVGFGKTEVAIRVAFKAVMSGYQVAVLVPTTLLAEQHYQVFRERLAQFPVKVTMLSRFRTPAQIKNDLKEISEGKIDIVIGTHRLLSADVIFHRIGLLIIDEEHRFGVKHKDKIRQMRTNVDTLYMSATPIPRTMNMILSKLKSMSLIQTSPKARLPIRTLIVPYDFDVIKDAITREVDRGGQVYFVHNRIETIHIVYEQLRKLLPNIRIIIGHGQQPERELEKVMIDFAEHQYDVLLATTIIESGIDIPNTNTIIVNRADLFGLAQLYQIRGRVGRSNRRAYAYLCVPNNLTGIARKRLETLTEYESLGAGYQIAMRDLEIRGAGSLLGNKQSGVITSVGFNFYNRLLETAVKNMLTQNPNGIWDDDEELKEIRKIELGTDYYFPPDYITDEKQKLQIYRRLVDYQKLSDFDDIAIELADRYGSLPDLAKNVIEYFRVRFISIELGLKTFMILTSKMIIEFDPKNLPPRQLLAKLIGCSPVPLSFDTTLGLRIIFTYDEKMAADKQKKLEFAFKMIEMIQSAP